MSPSGWKNLGPVSTGWLQEVGVHTLDDLRARDPISVWRAVQDRHPQANILLVYAMVGAVLGVHWNDLPPDLKEQLKTRARSS